MPNELKPCPFCGGYAEAHKFFINGKAKGYFISCEKCVVETKVFATKQGAEKF